MEHFTLLEALDAFAAQFAAQVGAAGAPSSEHAVHFCLALGLQAALDLPPGSIVFERPATGRERTDLWVRPPIDLAIEVKYHRPIPSGRNLPYTQIYGKLLADFNKVLRSPSGRHLVVLVADAKAVQHLHESGRDLLPFEVDGWTVIDEASIARLPETAATAAVSHGRWRPLAATLAWSHLSGGWHLMAWAVTSRANDDEPPSSLTHSEATG